MNNISLKSIKYESIKAIFASIADTEKISRADISEQTGLSLVTVGKIADALLELGVISQVKEIKPQAGRRAGILSVNPEKFALVIDITSYDFRFAVLDLRLNLLEKSLYQYNHDISYEENLALSIGEAAVTFKRKYNFENCFGAAVALPGPYNADSDSVSTKRIPELCSIRIKNLISRHFGGVPLLIDSHINAAAKSNVTYIADYLKKNIIYWYVGTNYVCGAYLAGGELILGKDRHACDFGSFVDNDGNTLNDKIGGCTEQKECAEVLSNAVYNVIKALSPHAIIMELDINFDRDDIISEIQEILMNEYHLSQEEMPEFRRARCKYRNSHNGLTMSLRELWLDRIVFGDK